jgi:predicted RNase H-like nuclease (RuvC/YqgF family)
MHMRTTGRAGVVAGLLVGLGGLLGAAGCVKAPERIDVRVGDPRPARVDSSRVPRPATLDEAQRELDQAYANIQQLEQDNARLQRKADEYKRERDETRREREAYKKRLEKYEGD